MGNEMVRRLSPKTVVLLAGSLGVLVIGVGFVVASMLSCTEVQYAYGPTLYECPDGTYIAPSNPHPYFDMLMPWLLGGILVPLWVAYRYRNKKPPE